MSDELNLENLVNFAVVVEGEVAETIAMSPTSTRIIAALSSNPIIVPISSSEANDLRNSTIENPWTYDGKKFIAPTE